MNETRDHFTSLLSLSDVRHSYNDNLAVKRVSFEVPEHGLSSIVGPSGCGKSTLLRICSGLMTPTAGGVRFGDEPVNGVPVGLAMVLQDYSRSLFPWLRVGGNVEFPIRRLPKAERTSRMHASLEAVGLADKSRHYPWQLSGGMQQRVAIARALAFRPRMLLMDEPFASVDAQTRAELEDLLLTLQRELKITVLVVTHDIDESIYLADRVIVLSPPPSVVTRIVDVDLPSPRDQLRTKADPEFQRIRAKVTQLLKDDAGATGSVATPLHATSSNNLPTSPSADW